MSFRDLLLTVGTGLGSLFLFDVRFCRFLEHNHSNEMICYKTGKGWLVSKSHNLLTLEIPDLQIYGFQCSCQIIRQVELR